MSFENAAYMPGSPGRVFLLDEEDIVDRLERLEGFSDKTLTWSETAGLRQIIRNKNRSKKQERYALYNALLRDRMQVAV